MGERGLRHSILQSFIWYCFYTWYFFLTTEFDPGILKAEFSHSNEKKPYQNYKHIIYAVQKVKNKYIWHRER